MKLYISASCFTNCVDESSMSTNLCFFSNWQFCDLEQLRSSSSFYFLLGSTNWISSMQLSCLNIWIPGVQIEVWFKQWGNVTSTWYHSFLKGTSYGLFVTVSHGDQKDKYDSHLEMFFLSKEHLLPLMNNMGQKYVSCIRAIRRQIKELCRELITIETIKKLKVLGFGDRTTLYNPCSWQIKRCVSCLMQFQLVIKNSSVSRLSFKVNLEVEIKRREISWFLISLLTF